MPLASSLIFIEQTNKFYHHRSISILIWLRSNPYLNLYDTNIRIRTHGSRMLSNMEYPSTPSLEPSHFSTGFLSTKEVALHCGSRAESHRRSTVSEFLNQ
jgi:hypothetical protein